RDTAGVLDVLQGAACGDTVRAPAPDRSYREEIGSAPGKLRIGILTHNPLDTGDIHPDCVAAARGAGELLESLGHNVEETFPAAELGTFNTAEEPLLGFIRAGTFVPYTPLANMTGEPAISLPLYWNGDNLPIGVQLMAAYGREDLLLRVAAQLEQARPWVDRL